MALSGHRLVVLHMSAFDPKRTLAGRSTHPSSKLQEHQLICAYLDNLDGKPRFHDPLREPNWAYLRLEFMARSMCDGISVWTREMSRSANERSSAVLV